MKRLARKDLLDLESLSEGDLRLIMDQAEAFHEVALRPVKKVPALRGKTVINLFFEPSTRTSTSFHLAAQRLSADVLDIKVGDSSVKKGETLFDTVATFEAMDLSVLVLRTAHAGSAAQVAVRSRASIVNAGDGMHEHPTQGLLDLFTLRRRFGKVEGLTVAIVGDVLHSRVARSDVWGLLKLGASVRLCGPSTLCPASLAKLWPGGSVTVTHDLREALEGADAVQVLRIQLERLQRFLFPSTGEYSVRYALTSERLALAKPGCLVLHPGPMNRGLEISGAVADGPQSAIAQQVANGVAVRMAVLYLLAGNEMEA
ncbi:MAG: aspartate carbamoyltransferase catalytic subunit [bacterium]